MGGGGRIAGGRRAAPPGATAVTVAPRSRRTGTGVVVPPPDLGPGPERTPRDRGQHPFAVPGMVLLAALAIYEGYDWLQVFPSGSHRPSEYLIGIAAAPGAYWLTRSVATGRVAARCRNVLVGAAVVVACAGGGWGLALGVAWLVLAASILVLSYLSERGLDTAVRRGRVRG